MVALAHNSFADPNEACLPLMSIGLKGLRGLDGLGDAQTTNTIIGLTSTGIATTGAVLASPALLGTAAIPIAGPFIALAAALVPIIATMFQGCGQSCVMESDYVNKIEPVLKENVDTYLNLPIPRTQSEQASALAVFQQAQQAVEQYCGNPQFGSSGQRCINDRFNPSSCQWRDSNGKCWNWVIGYHDPIANDPHVVPDSSAASTSILSSAANLFGGGSGGSGLPWIPILLLAAGSIIFFSSRVR